MKRKTKCFWGIVGTMLAAGVLCADTTPTYGESFEETNTWTGGTPTTSNYTYSATGSALPLPSAAHTKVLLVEGDAAYTNSTSLSASPLVDMMIQTAWSEEELAFPTSETTNDIQIAVAVDQEGYFNAYCKGKSNTASWYKISSTPTDQSGWARVSFLFDYTNNRCQIRIDGQPAASAYGYVTATATDTTTNGTWYALANTGTGVKSMKVIGCTAIDDVVMNVNTDYTYPLATDSSGNDAVDGSGVAYSWYDTYGIAWDGTKSYDSSGMTAAAKYMACLSPFDNQTFEMKSITTTTDSSTVKIAITIPATVDTATRKVVVDYGDSASFTSGTFDSQNVNAGATTVTITAPTSGVVYYRLRATDK